MSKIADVTKGLYVKGTFAKCFHDVGCGSGQNIKVGKTCLDCGATYKQLETKWEKYITEHIARESAELLAVKSSPGGTAGGSGTSTSIYKAVNKLASMNHSIKTLFENEVFNTFKMDEKAFEDAEPDIGNFLNNELFQNYEQFYDGLDKGGRTKVNAFVRSTDSQAVEMVKAFKTMLDSSFDINSLK